MPGSTPRPRSLSGRALVAGALLLGACGDPVATSATEGESSGAATTDGAPTSGSGGPTGTDATGSGGLTGSTSDTTPTGSGTDSDSAVSVTGTGEDTSTGSTGDTGDTGETGDTSTGTTGGDELPTSCQDGDFPGDAALCGAEGPACALRRDELVSAEQAFRNDMPALALRGDCGPALLFSEAVGGYFGFYGERSGAGEWSVEATPMAVATASLEYDPGADQALAMVDDGAFGVSLWRRSDGAWAQVNALAGMNHVRAPQLARDAEGQLHLAHIDGAQQVLHEVFDGAWSKSQLDQDADIHVRLALGPAAAPRLSYWSSKEATWKLYFAAPPVKPEPVTALGSNVLERAHTSLALAGPEATPWVWMARKQGDQQHHDLVLLHQLGRGEWAEETLAAEDPVADETCDVQAEAAGQVCAFNYVRLHPLALFAGGGGVRALYTAIHHKGTLVAECVMVPFPLCSWAPQTDTSTAELRVAWPGSEAAQHQVVALDVFSERATGRLDPGGNMHLAFYDQAPGTADPVVRYLAIGP